MRLLLEGPAIEPLLARVTAEHGPHARIVHAERVRTGGLAGFFAREHFEVTVEIDDAVEEEVVVEAAGGQEAVVDAAGVQEGVVDEGVDRVAPRGIDALVAAVEAAERREAPPHRPLSTESEAFAAVLTSLQSVEKAPTQTAPEQAAPVGAHAVADASAVPGAFLGSLRTAGVPSRLLCRLDENAGPVELLNVLRLLAPAPALVSRAGYMVAVVGERAEARGTARRIAERLRLADDAVTFFGAPAGDDDVEGQLSSLEQARRTSAAVRLGELPAVVVVEATHGHEMTAWTRDLLAALLPDQVVASVDATRKVADLQRWLGGWAPPGVAVDALSVHHASMSGDPATVLGLDVPVLEVDGLPATAATWLALLLNVVHPEGRGATVVDVSALAAHAPSGGLQ
ncbi:MAG TPA: hypothetical protein VFX41_06900 [Actinomycetales bacterium]|nr:hypothetical protein [Actinomycetales bacterium]